MNYSLKEKGKSYKLSEHFVLGEFACNDGSDTVKVDSKLIEMLEKLRSAVGGTVTINSGYRTPAYNAKVGGAASSQHLLGSAADIVVRREGNAVPVDAVCCLAQDLGFAGIGRMTNAVHVDVRAKGTYRGDERKGYSNNIGGDFYAYTGLTGAEVDKYRATEAPGTWSRKARAWAEQNGILQGTDSGKEYAAPCTREQAAVMLYRLWELMKK